MTTVRQGGEKPRRPGGLLLPAHAARLARMDRSAILDQSEKLDRHIALVEEDLTRQREIVADLMRHDYDATPAMVLLRQFEDLYTRLIADRDIVRRKLDYAPR